MYFPAMCEILQEKEGERFKIQHVEITKSALEMMKIGDLANRRSEYTFQETGTIVQLIDKTNGDILMSNTWMEKHTNHEFVRKANGNTLIAGLGIGFIVLAIQNKPKIKSITIIEKHKEIIDLVTPQLPLNNKITIINADIFNWYPEKGRKFDVIYFDIWNDICGDNYEQMKTLHRKFSRRLNRDNPKYWIGSWRREDCKNLSKSKRISSTGWLRW